MKTAAEQWTSFAKILQPSAGPVQRREMERSFYSGMLVAIEVMSTTARNAHDEELAVDLLNSFQQEIMARLVDFVKEDREMAADREKQAEQDAFWRWPSR